MAAMLKPVSRATSTWAVMRSAWAVNRHVEMEGRDNGASIEEIYEHVLTHRDKPIDYRTVATHLRTFEVKGLLVSHKEGRRLFYKPVVDELTAVTAEIRAFLDNVVHDDPELLDEVDRQVQERREEVRAAGKGRRAAKTS